MSLLATPATLPEADPSGPEDRVGDAARVMKSAYGTDMSFAEVTYEKGYHAAAHVHPHERLVYVANGSLSVFFGGKEYRLDAGDFLNIPRLTPHWEVVRGEAGSRTYECSSPPDRTPGSFGLFGPDEPAPDISEAPTLWLDPIYAEAGEDSDLASDDDVWYGPARKVKESVHKTLPGTGRLTSFFVYGEHSNLMLATRGSGYHSRPHTHACEQFNVLLAGNLWIFVKDKGYLLHAGDFFRVPKSTLHWAWNDGDSDSVLLEAHSPVLDPASKSNAVALIPDHRRPLVESVMNLFARIDRPMDEEAMKSAGQAELNADRHS